MAYSNSRDFIDIKHFGCAIANLRKQKRLSQWQVAKSAAISQSVLGKIESGQSMPMLSTALSIANCLDVDLFELIEYQAPDKDNFRAFYSKYRVLEALTPDQCNIVVMLAKNLANINAGIRCVN